LITGVTKDPIVHCMELAEQICLKNPEAIRACKSIYNAAPYLTVADGMLMESQLQDRIIGSDNQIEAVMAAMEKRLPNFKD
ncbi:MAG: hypothetical protein KTR16_13600, partial [Acidiferrobacterales bacterium]|nr:hypothetical protein [Acidiferrobacterales bacterium]